MSWVIGAGADGPRKQGFALDWTLSGSTAIQCVGILVLTQKAGRTVGGETHNREGSHVSSARGWWMLSVVQTMFLSEQTWLWRALVFVLVQRAHKGAFVWGVPRDRRCSTGEPQGPLSGAVFLLPHSSMGLFVKQVIWYAFSLTDTQ